MNYINDYNMEALACRVIQSYLSKEGAPTEYLDPKFLCEQVLGIRVLDVRLSHDGEIIGTTSFGKGKANIIDEDGEFSVFPLDGKTILVEKELAENPCGIGRYNFTVAHEAAHHILNMINQSAAINKNHVIVLRSSRSSAVEFGEWQTDRLAATLLMNRPMLYAAMKEAGIPTGIEVLDEKINNKSWYGFCRTAEILGVSLSALERRMMALSLIKQNYRKSSRSILDIWQ